MSTTCWLCVYNDDEVAVKIVNLITENIHSMSVDVIAEQASILIKQECEKQYGTNINLQGTTAIDIKTHIEEHMLHANVCLAVTLKDLIGISKHLKKLIYSVDEETGNCSLDSAQLKNYSTVVNQIASIYKLGDGNKLLFSKSMVTENKQ